MMNWWLQNWNHKKGLLNNYHWWLTLHRGSCILASRCQGALDAQGGMKSALFIWCCASLCSAHPVLVPCTPPFYISSSAVSSFFLVQRVEGGGAMEVKHWQNGHLNQAPHLLVAGIFPQIYSNYSSYSFSAMPEMQTILPQCTVSHFNGTCPGVLRLQT